jgi:cysteinyl-tRNA synthetase
LATNKFGGRKWSGEVLRLAMMKTHYRQPIDWTAASLEESEKILQNWIDVLSENQTSFADDAVPRNEVIEALGDDLNTSRMITELHRLASLGKRGDLSAAQGLHQSLKFFGLVSTSSFSRGELQEIGKAVVDDKEKEKIEAVLAARTAARARKDFAESDRIRDELAAMGVAIKDGKDADGKPVTTWEIAR